MDPALITFLMKVQATQMAICEVLILKGLTSEDELLKLKDAAEARLEERGHDAIEAIAQLDAALQSRPAQA